MDSQDLRTEYSQTEDAKDFQTKDKLDFQTKSQYFQIEDFVLPILWI